MEEVQAKASQDAQEETAADPYVVDWDGRRKTPAVDWFDLILRRSQPTMNIDSCIFAFFNLDLDPCSNMNPSHK